MSSHTSMSNLVIWWLFFPVVMRMCGMCFTTLWVEFQDPLILAQCWEDCCMNCSVTRWWFQLDGKFLQLKNVEAIPTVIKSLKYCILIIENDKYWCYNTIVTSINCYQDSPLPATTDEMVQLTYSTLSNPSTRPVVIIVDALNQVWLRSINSTIYQFHSYGIKIYAT